jgi:hypothetical protein
MTAETKDARKNRDGAPRGKRVTVENDKKKEMRRTTAASTARSTEVLEKWQGH